MLPVAELDNGSKYRNLTPADFLISSKDIDTDDESWRFLRCTKIFVDKSQLISAIFDQNLKGIIITRPRRWGKSVNLDMIEQFCNCPLRKDGSINRAQQQFNRFLFKGGSLKDHIDGMKSIKLKEEELNQFKTLCQSHKLKQGHTLSQLKLVFNQDIQFLFSNFIVLKIKLAFKMQTDDLHFLRKKLLSQVQSLYSKHNYLKQYQSNYTQIQREIYALEKKEIATTNIQIYVKRLVNFLYRFHQKRQIVVLIDEFDYAYSKSLQQSVKSNLKCSPKQIVEQISEFISLFIKGVDANQVRKVICTGIKNAYAITSISGTAHLRQETIDALDSFTSQYYGFSQQEIKDQLLKNIFKNQQHKKLAMINIENYYNGYKFKQSSIYNPYSVMRYLQYILNKGCIQKVLSISPELCFWSEKEPGQGLLRAYLDQMLDGSHRVAYTLFKSLQAPHNQVEFKAQTKKESKMIIKENARQFEVQDIIDHLITSGYLTLADKPDQKDQNKKIKIIKIPNQETLLFFCEPLNSYFLGLLKHNHSGLHALRKKFDLKDWTSCATLLNESANKMLKMFLAEDEALMSALMLFEFVLCLEKKYNMNYEKTLLKIRPDIIFYPIEKKYPAVIHENKIVLYDNFTKNIVPRKKQEAIFQIFQKNYLKAFFGELSLSREYQSCRFILRGVVGYRQKKGQPFKIEMMEKQYSYHEANLLYQFSVILSLYLIKQEPAKINNIQQLVNAIKIPIFSQVQSTLEMFEIIINNSKQDSFQYNQNILVETQKKWAKQRIQLLNKKDKLTKFYCEQFSYMIQFMKMWYWGERKLNEDNKWSDLKQALEVFYAQNLPKFNKYNISCQDSVQLAIKYITPIQDRQKKLQKIELETNFKRPQQEILQRTMVDFKETHASGNKLMSRKSADRKIFQAKQVKQEKQEKQVKQEKQAKQAKQVKQVKQVKQRKRSKRHK